MEFTHPRQALCQGSYAPLLSACLAFFKSFFNIKKTECVDILERQKSVLLYALVLQLPVVTNCMKQVLGTELGSAMQQALLMAKPPFQPFFIPVFLIFSNLLI